MSVHSRSAPALCPQLTLSDGAIKMFEVPMTEFHKLRYSVAKVRLAQRSGCGAARQRLRLLAGAAADG